MYQEICLYTQIIYKVKVKWSTDIDFSLQLNVFQLKVNVFALQIKVLNTENVWAKR